MIVCPNRKDMLPTRLSIWSTLCFYSSTVKGGGSAEGLSSADLYELKYFPATLFKL